MNHLLKRRSIILFAFDKKIKIEKIDYRYVLSNKKDLKEVLIIAE